MNKERLEHLKTILQTVAEEKKPFDMSAWFDIEGPVNPEHPQVPCGTAACAMGYACLDPLFKAQGLDVLYDAHFDGAIKGFIPFFQGETSFGAASAFFGIDWDDSEFLFDDTGYYEQGAAEVAPHHVITRIDWLLSGRTPEEFADAQDD